MNDMIEKAARAIAGNEWFDFTDNSISSPLDSPKNAINPNIDQPT